MMRFPLSRPQLAALGTIGAAMVAAAVEAIRHGTGNVDWVSVAMAAVLAGVGAYAQSRKAEQPS